MNLRLVTPTLGRSPWAAEGFAASAALDGAERIVVCPGAQREAVAAASAGARVVAEARPGLYAAVNQGLRQPGAWDAGTYVNDDDLVVAAGLGQALAALGRDPGLDAVYGRVAMIDAAGRLLAEIPVARRGGDLGALLAAGIVPLAQPGTVFRRAAFEALGGFDERLAAAGDLDFIARALAAGRRVGFVDARVAAFRVHGGQISAQRELVRRETAGIFAAARGRAAWRRAARAAALRFRLANLGAYLDRIRRHGPVSMEALYGRG